MTLTLKMNRGSASEPPGKIMKKSALITASTLVVTGFAFFVGPMLGLDPALRWMMVFIAAAILGAFVAGVI